MTSKELIKKIDIGRIGNGSVTYNDMCLILNKEETLELLQYIEKIEKDNQELKASYETLKKDYWELDKVEEDILQKFYLQGQVISAIQDEILNKIEHETIYEDVSPLCEVTISINKKIFDMLFEKKEELGND